MTSWVEEKMEVVTTGRTAQAELSDKITEFLKTVSGSNNYHGVDRGSLKLGEEDGEKVIIGKVSRGGDRFGETYTSFRILVKDLEDVEGFLKYQEELKRINTRNIF